MTALSERLEKLAEPVLAEMGLELVDLELSRSGGRLLVRLFLDRVEREHGGVSVEECGDFNLALSRLLDVEGLIEESYVLEVSSPGLDRRIRKLRDFLRYMGETATVFYKVPVAGRKKARGKIIGADENGISLETGEGVLKIGHDEIARAKLLYRFEEK
jgi:ribosome maturation factor RimP